jgi:mannan endo-1,6-alpha-mannosidase
MRMGMHTDFCLGMIEYSSFTGDDSYTKTLQQALTANYGPANDFILDYRRSQTGNDDQAFWSLAVMSALEYQFPDADKAPASYLDVAVNSFNNIVGRWDETSCGGGLKWQIYPENAYGYNYKNSISNGAAFALGARLARYTGNQTYADWSVKIYDWTKKVGLISDKFEVFDGADDKTNCGEAKMDHTTWSYNNAMFLHGSAFMFDYTKGDKTWKDRVTGFMSNAESLFFKPYDNATNIMFEMACETGETGRHCNLDQQSFKAYLSRFMAKTAILAPFTKDAVTKCLKASAVGAASSCSGGADGSSCGSKWYTGAWDGTSGVGQQLSALEVTQALLMIKQGTVPAKKNEVKPEPSTSATTKPSTAPASIVAPVPSSKAPVPVLSSAVPSFTFAPSSAAPAPAPSSSAPASSGTPGPVKPSVGTSTSTALPAHFSSAIKPGGEFGQKPSSTPCTKSDGLCTCTPSVTKTVYVPPVTKTPASTSCTPTITTTVYVPPVASGSLVPSVPVNGSVPRPTPSPSQPLEFQGAAANIHAAATTIFGAAVIAIVAGLL